MSIKAYLRKAMNVVGANAGMPSASTITAYDGKGTGSAVYTAPKDGFIRVEASSINNPFFSLGLAGKKAGTIVAFSKGIGGAMLPIEKGDTISLYFEDLSDYVRAYFIPAEGAA